MTFFFNKPTDTIVQTQFFNCICEKELDKSAIFFGDAKMCTGQTFVANLSPNQFFLKLKFQIGG